MITFQTQFELLLKEFNQTSIATVLTNQGIYFSSSQQQQKGTNRPGKTTTIKTGVPMKFFAANHNALRCH